MADESALFIEVFLVQSSVIIIIEKFHLLHFKILAILSSEFVTSLSSSPSSHVQVIHTLGSRDDIVESSVKETEPVAMVSSEMMMTINHQPLTDTTTGY